MHNSFDLEQVGNEFRSISHNFPKITGKGETEIAAIRDMERKIIYLKDNSPQEFADNLRDRIKRGLSCGCGHKLDSPLIWVVGGT